METNLPHISSDNGCVEPIQSSLVGPEDDISVVFYRDGRGCKPFGHIYIETFKVMRREICVSGWAYCPDALIEEIRFSSPWASQVLSLRTGVERGDIQARFGGGRDALLSGFSFTVEIPAWFSSLSFEIVFDNACSMVVKDRGEISAELRVRFWNNLGHRFFFWAKPAKQAFKKKVSISHPASPQAAALLRSCQAGSTTGQVIVPVYNGLKYLATLLPKLCKDPDITRLILIDDGSTDVGVVELLNETAKQYPQVELIRNKANLGFVKTVNKGLRLVSDDCIVLNTDVDIPSGWVGRLLEPIRRDPSVATTTPFTNAGTLLSFPEWLVDNDRFNDLPVEKIDKEFQKLRPVDPIPELPSGIGFCMGMSLDAIRKVGVFDEASFGRGYGEENDWCQRAIKSGYRNLPVLNLYVYHKHGGSYAPEEKENLLNAHLKLMGRKHPAYHHEVQRFVKCDPLKRHREVVLLQILSWQCSRGVCLIFDHQEGGGANLFCERRIAEVQDNGYFPLTITHNRRRGAIQLKAHHPRWSGVISFTDEADCFQVICSLALKKLLLNSIVFSPHPISMLRRIQDLAAAHPEVEMEIFLHDYHGICPSHNLIGKDGKFCNIPEESVCSECLKSNPYAPDAMVTDINAWRKVWQRVFEAADTIRAFSAESADLVLRVFPGISGRLQVEAHGQHFFSNPVSLPVSDSSEQLVVGVVGSIGQAKGASVIVEMAREGTCRVVVIGKLAPGFESFPGLIVHGTYEREELRDLLERYKVSVCLIPSIWPETYNFVADELMTLAMPIVSFDIGAHAERIKKYHNGKVIPLSLADKPAALAREISVFGEELVAVGTSDRKSAV